MDSSSVLITTDLHPIIFDGLRMLGFNYDYQPTIGNDDVKKIIGRYTGMLISTSTIVDRTMLDLADNLKFIGRAGSGLEIIDLEYAKKKGVYCFNTPEGNRDAVAEHAIGTMLSLMHRISISDAEVHKCKWEREPNRGDELMNKTVGLIGYGNTGMSMAKKLSGFEVKVLAYDKYKRGFESDHVKEVSLETLHKEADIFSIHLPLTPETEYWIDYEFLRRFKKSIYLLNTSRGKIVKTIDVIRCLREGKIKGAGLDVLENEKLDKHSVTEKKIFDELILFENVIITPHIAGWTFESKEKIANKLLEKIKLIW